MLGVGNGFARACFRRLGSVGTAVLFTAAVTSAPATADVRLEFSDSVAAAIRDSGTGNPARVQRRLERRINESLKELGKTNTDAKALHESGQTLRVVCFGDPEAIAAGLTQDFDIRLGGDEGAETAGDFDASGKPKAKGKAIIAIDCGRLREKGFDRAAMPDGQSMYGVLLHELLHAANKDRRHPPDDLDLYREWERALEAAFLRARGVATPGTAPSAPAPPTAPAPSPTSPATPGTAPPGSPATPPGAPAPEPGRAGDLLFDDFQIAGEVRDLIARADAAAPRCDAGTYRAVIDRIRSLAEQALVQRAEDSGRLYGLAGNLELEIGERFKHCPDAPPGVPPPFQPTVPGPPPRVQLDQGFRSPAAAREARTALEKAEAAVQNCTPEAYDETIGALRRAAEREDQRARDIIRSAGETEAATGQARAIREDAEKLRALADKLARERAVRFQTRCPPGTPGASLPGTRPGTGLALNIRPGGTVTWTPQVPGGTIFTRVGDPTSALPMAWSGSTLSGGGVRIDAKIPLGDPFGTRRDWIFTPRVHYGYAEAHASGAVAPRGPPGSTTTVGPFTGRAYLSPAPDGTTGLFYGASGQTVDIDSHTHQFGLDLLLSTRLLQGEMHGWQYSVFAGGGLSYRFDWTGHTIDERNLSFDGVWSRTELKTDDHFFGARFAGGVKVENGRWLGSLAAYVAPGVVVSNASARQWNACSICSPPNDSFMVAHERTKSGFGVRTGVEATVGYRLTRSVSIGAFAQFDYSSRQSVWRNPVKPQLGPPHLGVDDAMTAAFGVRIGIFIP